MRTRLLQVNVLGTNSTMPEFLQIIEAGILSSKDLESTKIIVESTYMPKLYVLKK
ncbi:20571_t:CDS:2 [Gigaspora margarita]|uniref:20571_t:CDS:1 n=1 Tax=Gigaspora margarita TaxID=4874 RepID=A0ABN7UDG5_GIGMA|nr:20571_t:CDS:2 [Gigaspora margarita]